MPKQSFTPPAFSTNNISALPPEIEGQAENLQELWDKASVDIKQYLNDLLTELSNTLGSYRIGHNSLNLSANNVGDALEELKAAIAGVVLQSIPDGTVTDVKLSNDPTQIKSRVSDLETKVGSDFVIGTSTIPTTGWVAHTGDNAFKYSLAIATVSTADWVDITIDKDSQDVALDAGINPTVDEYNGGVIIYANTVPTAPIPIRYSISREV